MKKIVKLNITDIENIVKNTINEYELPENDLDLNDSNNMIPLKFDSNDNPEIMDDSTSKPPKLLIGKNVETGELTIIDTERNKVLYTKMM